MADMTDEQKRAAAGTCAFLMLTAVATAAFILNLFSFSSCKFATRLVNLNGVPIDEACDNLGLAEQYAHVCDSLLGDTQVGFFGFEVDVANETTCYDYTISTPWGYANPYFDTKFNSSKALIITAACLGGISWVILMMASCCQLDRKKMKFMASFFFLATLFQGLGLLFLASSACDVGFFAGYFPIYSNITHTDTVAGITCDLSTGAKCAISATVLYFLCNCLAGAAVPPEPIWVLRDQPNEEPAPRDAATEEAAPAAPAEEEDAAAAKAEEA